MSASSSRPSSRSLTKGKSVPSKKASGKTATAQGSQVKVVGYLDQHEAKWLRVGFREHWAFGSLDDLIGQPATFYQSLAQQGVVIVQHQQKGQLLSRAQAAKFEKRAHVIDRLGWNGKTYVRPGSELPTRINGARVLDARRFGTGDWATGGSFQEWKQGVHRFANDQALPTFVLGSGFASLIQRLVPEVSDNVGFELYDLTSIGKSTLLMLAGSIFGPGEAFTLTWSTTVNALEPTMASRGDALLLLDEENLFLDSTPNASRELGNAIHKLAAGSEKVRLGDPVKPDHRFLFLSSCNEPIAEVVKGIGSARAGAVDVRMPTIPADAGQGYGVFDKLPPGCSDSAEAIKELTLLVKTHYGWAALAFIKVLERRLAHPVRRDRLIATIRRSMAEFKDKAGTSGNQGAESRVADKFALVLVASVNECKFGCGLRWPLVSLPMG
jgi:putative DNA primase/helicase